MEQFYTWSNQSGSILSSDECNVDTWNVMLTREQHMSTWHSLEGKIGLLEGKSKVITLDNILVYE